MATEVGADRSRKTVSLFMSETTKKAGKISPSITYNKG